MKDLFKDTQTKILPNLDNSFRSKSIDYVIRCLRKILVENIKIFASASLIVLRFFTKSNFQMH